MEKTILAIFALILINSIIMAVSAQSCPPSIPVTYSGEVLHDDEVIFKDFDIVAYVGDYGSMGAVNNGEYLIDISSCYGSGSGTIEFWINGVKANEEPNYNGEEDWGKEINLDLTFNEIPPSVDFCGNGVKDSGEVCDGNDFGGLTCSNYGFNSGSLECSDSCINIHIDNCYNSQSGGGNGGSSGGSSSGGSSGNSYTLKEPTTTDEDKKDEGLQEPYSEILKTLGKSEDEKKPGITGAVIGNLGKAGVGIIIFLIAIIALTVIVNIKKTRATHT